MKLKYYYMSVVIQLQNERVGARNGAVSDPSFLKDSPGNPDIYHAVYKER